MKTITFQGTEKQLYNLQDIYEQSNKDLPREVQIRVYFVEIDNIYTNYHSELTNEEFILLAEDEGRVYSLEDFQDTLNKDEVNIGNGYIRFISVLV